MSLGPTRFDNANHSHRVSFRTSLSLRGTCLLLGSVFAASCAHRGPVQVTAITEDPQVVFRQICAIGGTIQKVSGTLQMRAKSPEASGQFPASVQVDAPSRTLDLEVTNPLGGTEARIHIKGSQYRIETGRGKKLRQDEGQGTWGGIPLHWAIDLFLGKFPCPTRVESTVKIEEGNLLVVQVPADLSGSEEVYRYALEASDSGKQFWPKALDWNQNGALGGSVRFQFFAPEEGTSSPTRWEAVSTRGEVKAKWREREVRKEGNAGK